MAVSIVSNECDRFQADWRDRLTAVNIKVVAMEQGTMSLRLQYWMAGAIALLLVFQAFPARAQLNVIRRARQLKTEQEERRTNLEQQAEDITEGGSSSTPSRSSPGDTATTGRSQPPTSGSESSRPDPVTPPAPVTTGTQPQQGTSPSIPATVDTVAELSPEEQYEKSLASWHVSRNVCTRSWTADEFNRIFARIDRDLEVEVCDR
ncbi:MAG: hypothetical protein AAFY15_06790 [Cyanobacteria bacterium J06648_11]